MAPDDDATTKPERFSRVVEDAKVDLSPEQVRDLESENGLRQFDLMDEMIGEAIAEAAANRRWRLKPHHLMDLNREAVAGLSPSAGAYRTSHIFIEHSEHRPPDPRRVARLVDEMCDTVRERWDTATPAWLAAYVMWRTNWIHPFHDGNGRTSRTASYLVLCAKLGYRIPGRKTIPDMISADKHAYYEALEMCDNADQNGVLSVTAMEDLLDALLAKQLLSVSNHATGRDDDADA